MILLNDLRDYAVSAFRPALSRVTSTISPPSSNDINEIVKGDSVLQSLENLIYLFNSNRFYLLGLSDVEDLWEKISQDELLIDILFDATARLTYQIESHLTTVAIQTDSAKVSLEEYVQMSLDCTVKLVRSGVVKTEGETFVKPELNSKETINLYLDNLWLFTMFVANLVDLTAELLIVESPSGLAVSE